MTKERPFIEQPDSVLADEARKHFAETAARLQELQRRGAKVEFGETPCRAVSDPFPHSRFTLHIYRKEPL